MTSSQSTSALEIEAAIASPNFSHARVGDIVPSAVFPELEPHCGSWVITKTSGDTFEVYDRRTAEAAFAGGWRVETAAQYLGRINREARSSC